MHRRKFVQTLLAAMGTTLARAQAAGRRPRVLIRSSWRTVNIGDIAHTPGLIRLLQENLPEADLTLWPVSVGDGVRELLQQAFPRLQIVDGRIDDSGKPLSPQLEEAWKSADFFLHGSGPGLAQKELIAWQKATTTPFGIFGITTDFISGLEGGTLAELGAIIAKLPANRITAEMRSALDHASFCFCRDTLSLEAIRRQHLAVPVLEFGPDATFAWNLRDEARAAKSLGTAGLAPGKFICVIPRLRYTPHSGDKPTAWELQREQVNRRTMTADLEKLRAMIVPCVRKHGLQVYLVPEMQYEVKLGAEQIRDLLPEDVKASVFCRPDFWMPDEAAAVYAQALAVVSFECHSPILALSQGTPAFYIRQPTDTIKGQMYRDLGLDEWFFEIDQTSAEALTEAVRKIHSAPAIARAKVATAMGGVNRRQREMVATLQACLPSATSRPRA